MLLALSACQAPGEMTDAGGTQEAPSPSQQADPQQAGDAKAAEAEPSSSEAADSATELALQPSPSIPGPPIDDDPDHFLGLSPGELKGRLGSPDLLRRETPAEVWQYRGERCILDLFIYDKEGNKQVVYLEARDLQAAEVESRDCLNMLLTARRSAASS